MCTLVQIALAFLQTIGPVGYPESTLYTYKYVHTHYNITRVIDITYGMLDKCKTADGGNMF